MVTDMRRDALKSLPWLFHLADLTLRLGWNPRLAQEQLYRWRRQDLACDLGGRSGVYANLVVSRYPNWEMGRVSTADRICSVNRFEVNVERPEWFYAVAAGIRSGEGVALPSLAPVWALDVHQNCTSLDSSAFRPSPKPRWHLPSPLVVDGQQIPIDVVWPNATVAPSLSPYQVGKGTSPSEHA